MQQDRDKILSILIFQVKNFSENYDYQNLKLHNFL